MQEAAQRQRNEDIQAVIEAGKKHHAAVLAATRAVTQSQQELSSVSE
jgi:hypothetical protein